MAFSIGLFMLSCDGDENTPTSTIEGHWIYTATKVDISVTDPVLKEKVEEYIKQNVISEHTSYEFKNDKTYYYYLNFADPLKGKYKMQDKDYATLDDSRGLKKVICEDPLIYVQSDLKSQIAKDLKISESKIIEATITEVFEKGLKPSN